MDKLLFGAAYYDEYMPCERLDEDIKMMKAAGINVVRIAESTWSTCEPQEGHFDFSHVEKVCDAMEAAGIKVIIGTPTYAIPSWMVKSYPDVIASVQTGRGIYGARQIMDITNPVYLFYAERVIRKLLECTAKRKCVIGYQLDNETKHYGTAGHNVQQEFVKYLRTKFGDDCNAMNREFGLDYWSNRVDNWEDFPDVRGTINGSLGAEFEKFQRTLVVRFLSWQAGIVNEYKRKEQFVTQNFDYEWRGYSFGVQPFVNHFEASACLTISGVDIYHPTQDYLTGEEIAFGGDLARSLKQDNYLVLETQAQGFPGWVPYKGQLRLQAYSHIASGANSVMYWHWHSIHNSFETYWKGLLSHDFQENDTYREAKIIGKEFEQIGAHLVNLKKKNRIAVLVSNESLTALNWFGIDADAGSKGKTGYNDVVRWIYNQLYKMNAECDFISPDSPNMENYDLLIVPALYAACDSLLERINEYVEAGGNLIATFKSAFANENVKVSHDIQPHIIHKCIGASYQQFTFPVNVTLTDYIWEVPEEESEAEVFMELLKPDTAQVLARYNHENWKEYAAITKNSYGKGTAVYIGCMTSDRILQEILKDVLKEAGICEKAYSSFPVIMRKGTNDFGKTIRFYLNYSPVKQSAVYNFKDGKELLYGTHIKNGQKMELLPWDLNIYEECEV